MSRPSQRGQTAAWPGLLLLLLLLAIPCRAQELPESVKLRLHALPRLTGAKAANECKALSKLIDENKTISHRRRAAGLDRLREACSRKLALTDPELVNISELSVKRRNLLEAQEPGALSEALRDLGFSYHYLGDLKKAQELYQRAVAICRHWRGRGTTNEDLAAALESLSSTYLDDRNFREARKAAEESLQLRLKAVPFLPEKVVKALVTRARIEEQEEDLEATWKTLLEAHQISQKLGPEHVSEAARVASNLGEIAYRRGELPEAVEYLQEAERLRSRDRKMGCAVATTHLLLGQILFDYGDYPQANEYYRKAVDGHVACWGKDPYRYGDALTTRATVLEESGEWDEALRLQLEALELRQAAADQNPADKELQRMLARSLAHLGALQQRMGTADARRSLEHALAIQDQIFARQASADRAETLLALAEHWREAGSPERARPLIERCLRELGSIREQGSLLVRAMELSARVAADPAAGLKTIDQTGYQVRQLFGKGSPRLATVLQVRGELRRRQNDRQGALGDALLSQRLSLPHIRTVVQAFPRDQALAFAADRHQSLDLALDLLAETPGLSPDLLEQVWQTAASGRMLVRDAEIDRRRLSQATADPRLASVARQLSSARKRFAYLLVQTYGTLETQADRLQKARQELVEAEASLALKTRALLAGQSATTVSVQELRRRLPGGAALVVICQYRQATGSNAYLAFILNGSEPARAVALGKAATIDWLVQDWRAAILSPQADAAARTRAGQVLRRAVWDPIARRLSGSRTIFLVPDGAFHLVPLTALPAERGGYLIEQGWSVHLLTSERDLLGQPETLRPGPWLALGGVDYEQAAARPVPVSRPSHDVLRGSSTFTDPWRGNDCQRRELPSFAALPGSRGEIQDLASLSRQLQGRLPGAMPALTLLSGKDATEQGLRDAVAGQRIIHLATHGFAFARSCGKPQPAIRGIGGLSLGTGPGTAEQPPLSGLVLAGANERRKAQSSDQDGILTEEEILDLNLDAADWVVLSACETGLGRLRPGEGVVGMLRAFQVAGAKTVIVSLWSVGDRAARAWMRDLYHARFERQLSTVEAMRQAALHRLHFYREQGDDNPIRWAGFVATGQWK
jgi:CHAT domain-containing protein